MVICFDWQRPMQSLSLFTIARGNEYGKSSSELNQQQYGLEPLLCDLRRLVTEARARALKTVDVIQVQTYCQVGRHRAEFEQS